MISVMIADDQEIIRQSLEMAINSRSDMKVVCVAENGKEAVDLAKKHKPDVLLLDIRMPIINGVECIKLLKEKRVTTKIIVLTTFDDDEYIFEALKNGASGYLLKGISLEELIKSLRIVVNGGSLISPDVTTKVLELFSNLAKADYTNKVENKLLTNLNSSELGIIKLIGRGLSNREITGELGISEGTVRNYISHILNALNLKNRTQIAIFAVQSGLVVEKINEI
jgi:DNA-binding NarL/FixJ family response regulator